MNPTKQMHFTAMATMWENVTVEKRTELLATMGHNTEWAAISSLPEIAARGGGMMISDLIRLSEKAEKRYLQREN